MALCMGVLCSNKVGGWYVKEGKVLRQAALRCHLKWKGGFEEIKVQTAPFSTLLAKAS